MVVYTLARPARLSLDTVAVQTGLHPELIRRFVALSLIDASTDSAGGLWFSPNTVATVARIQRLRAGLSLNYAAIGLVIDLLDRIDVLEAQVRRVRSERPWT
jgi:DNA-binding transcriptional MerR regulator